MKDPARAGLKPFFKKTWASVDQWVFAPGSAKRLAGVRIGLCLVLALRLSRGIYLELADQPEALFRPLSFMQLFSAMPSREVTLIAQILGVSAALLAAAGMVARFTLPVALMSAVFLNGMHTSIGKVMHNDVMLILALLPLVAAPMADAWSIGSRKRNGLPKEASARYGWPVRSAMVVVAGAYFFAGLSKLGNSGPAWVFSENMRWILYAASDSQYAPNSIGLFIASRAGLAQLAAASTLLFELSFPVVLWRPKAAWLYVPGALLVHGGIWLTMGLDYFAWMATVLIVFIDWPKAIARIRTWSLLQ